MYPDMDAPRNHFAMYPDMDAPRNHFAMYPDMDAPRNHSAMYPDMYAPYQSAMHPDMYTLAITLPCTQPTTRACTHPIALTSMHPTTLRCTHAPQNSEMSLSDSQVPAYHYFGERNAQVIHCRLRLEMSNHNKDIVNRHLRADPKCSCGYSKETAEHYLLHCPNYSNIPARTILTLPSGQTDIRTLLYDN